MVCNFVKKKTLVQVFSCKFSKIIKKTYFVEHVWMDAWVKLAKKTRIHKIYLQENTSDGVLFSAIADMWVYRFSKRDFMKGAFLWKLWSFSFSFTE